MSTLTITINTTDGAAMTDDGEFEVAEVLRRLADRYLHIRDGLVAGEGPAIEVPDTALAQVA